MRVIVFLLLTFIAACSGTKKLHQQKQSNISKLVFRHYYEIDSLGEAALYVLQDSLIEQLKSKYEIDQESETLLKNFSIAERFRATPETEIHIEMDSDTIWRYKTEFGKVIGDYFSIRRENGILYYHAKHDKSFVYKQVDLFKIDHKYIVIEYPDDRKKIMDFDCYRVVIEKEEKTDEEFPISAGNTIYEMYVTDKIDLPLHALININQKFSNMIPLELKITQEKLSGHIEVFELISIK